MKILTAMLTASLLSVPALAETTVRRILPDEVRIVEPGEPLRFWREVCVSEDQLTMTVLRTIRDVGDDPDTFIKLPSVQYGGFAQDGCQASIYELIVPLSIEPGDYIYEPRGLLNSGEVIDLPVERFRVE